MLKGIFGFVVLGAACAVPAAAYVAVEDAAAAPRYTLDTPLAELIDDPASKAVLDELLPGLTTLPELEMIKPLSLRQIAPFSEGKLTDELLAKVEARLAELPSA